MQTYDKELVGLIEKGDYDAATESINNLPDDDIWLPYYQVKLYRNMGHLTKGLDIVENTIDKVDFHEFDKTTLSSELLRYFKINAEKAYLQYLQGTFHDSLLTIQSNLDQIDQLKPDHQSRLEDDVIFFNFTRGNVEASLGRLDTALIILKDVYDKLKETDHIRDIAFVLNDIGTIYYHKGDLKTAIEYFSKSLKLKEEFSNPHDIAFTLNNIGALYYDKGDLEKAASVFERGLEVFVPADNYLDTAFANDSLGLIHFAKNQIDDALKYLNKGLELRKRSENEILISSSLLNLIQVNLANDRIEVTQEYLDELSDLVQTTNSSIPRLYYTYARAIYNKQIPLMKAKVEAQELFKSIIAKKTTNFEIVFNSMYHLCDLLIEEYFLFQNDKIYQQAKDLVIEIVEYARNTNSSIKIIESLILESKFESLEGKYETSVNILEHARLIAEQQDLPHLLQRVEDELDHIQSKLDEWRLLVERNSSLIDRIVEIGLKDYITSAGMLYYQDIGPYSNTNDMQ